MFGGSLTMRGLWRPLLCLPVVGCDDDDTPVHQSQTPDAAVQAVWDGIFDEGVAWPEHV